MNRGRRLKQLRKFILKYGEITEEYKRPPDKNYRPYRKGSHYIIYNSKQLGLSYSGGSINRYKSYRDLANTIKHRL